MIYSLKDLDYREVSFRDDKDYQGIPWNTSSMQISREDLRSQRLQQPGYRSLATPIDFLQPPSEVNSPFMNFYHNYARTRCHTTHFQLRDNLHFEDSIYFINKSCAIEKFDPVSHQSSTVFTSKQNLKITVFNVSKQHLAIAGDAGELVLHDSFLDKQTYSFRYEDVINSCRMYEEGSRTELMVSLNDHTLRVLNFEYDTKVYNLTSAVNYAAKNGNLIGCALDSTEVPILDTRTERKVMEFRGHCDHSFGIEWNPLNEFQVASANQDHSVKLWDTRTQKCVQTLCGKIGSVYKLEFLANYLAFLETKDFVHVYDTRDLSKCQVIDLFGEMCGLCFDKNTEKSLYIGVSDSHFCSILEYRTCKDSLIYDLNL